MLTVLAIENSSRRSSVAVWKEAACIFNESFSAGRRETGPLFSVVQRALQCSGHLDWIAVGTGPGSYNGLRAAIALGEGLALGRGIPCTGWSSLLAFPPQRRVLAGDARSGQYFFAVVENNQFVCQPELLAAGDLEARIASMPVTRKALRCWVGEHPPSAGWARDSPSARELCIVAMRGIHSTGFSAGRAFPLYLKPPHITRSAKGRRDIPRSTQGGEILPNAPK